MEIHNTEGVVITNNQPTDGYNSTLLQFGFTVRHHVMTLLP